MEVQRSQIAYPTLDRLGNLPAVILDDILSRLPIKEAVKTSILSKEWQYKWTDLSKLVFDGEQMVEVGSDRYHFAESIYLTLQSHSGHISNFKLKNLSDVEHLRARDIPKSLFAAPNQLRKLAIHSLSLRVRNEAVFALTMLDLFQNIHHLHIKFLVWEPEELFEIEDPLSQSSCVFKALRTVKIAVKGDIPDDLWHPEIEFFKFLLALSPVLEGIDIEFDGEGAKMFKKLCKTELSSYQYGLKKLDVSFEEA